MGQWDFCEREGEREREGGGEIKKKKNTEGSNQQKMRSADNRSKQRSG